MSKPGIINGLIMALVISIGSALVLLFASGLFTWSGSFSLVLNLAALAYLVYLLKYSQARVGKVVVMTGWAMVSAFCWFIDPPLAEQVLLQAGLIWLVRSLYFHSSLMSAMLDLALVAAGLAASSWAMINTGSLAAALWSFFLVQALFCWIPGLAYSKDKVRDIQDHNTGSFQTAHRVATDAVRKLTQP